MEHERRQQGFTLMELLIVVAIIGVLVAIAIPMFTTQLERSREAVDIANMRSARSVASAAYMMGDLTEDDGEVYFDGSGTLATSMPDPYGKGTAADGGTEYDNYDATQDYTGSVICAQVRIGGTLDVYWNNKPVYTYTGATFASGDQATVREWVQTTLEGFESYYGKKVSERDYAYFFIDTYDFGGKYGGSNGFDNYTSAELNGVNIPHYAFDLSGTYGRRYEPDGAAPPDATERSNSPRLYVLVVDGQVYTNVDPETGKQTEGWVAWK